MRVAESQYASRARIRHLRRLIVIGVERVDASAMPKSNCIPRFGQGMARTGQALLLDY